jgi:GT2 family glycosyltransferase/glycosyltransferase involved in cell wall biosynthesis
MHRQDLADAGLGKGMHGFKIALPVALFDGAEHSIEVRETSTGIALPGSPRKFKSSFADRCHIGLEGSSVAGWVKLPEGVKANRLLELQEGEKEEEKEVISNTLLEVLEGEQVIGSAHGMLDDENSDIVRFRIPLETSIFDGRPHLFSVRSNDPAMTIGQMALITPTMLTPEASLRRYLREGLTPRLSMVAGFRYESLSKSIERFAIAATGLSGRTSGPAADADKQVIGQITQLARVHSRLVQGFMETDKTFEPLTFPHVESPRVSIVIPVHDKFYVTYHCLASLLLAANSVSFEVILVDDGSKDESARIPELIKGVRYVRNDEAQGFVRACNRGGDLARGEYVVMLNNDTEVTSGWLDELLWPFDHFISVGMTGAKLLYPDGTLQEAGGIVWNTGDPWNYGRKDNPHDPRYNYARQVDYLSGACIMLPLALWKELEGFNEAFAPAYFEDTDLAFRVRSKGYKTIYAPLSQVVHFEGMSSGISTATGTKRFQEINRPKFKSRWVGVCRHNGKVGADLELNKDRNVTFRALVLDAETPMPDQNAGSYAAIQEMRMLQVLGFKCTFAPNNMAWMGHYTEDLQRMGVECLYAPFAGSISEVIEKRGKEFDLIYITRYSVAENYISIIREYAPQAKIILMNADLHFLRELRAAIQKKAVLAPAIATRDAELAVMRKVDLVLSYTDVEKAVILSHNLDSTRVAKCPWVTEVASDVPGFEGRADIAYLGGFGHHPNVEAVEWFVAKVMPLMREALPGVKFRVYGSNIPKSLLALAEKDDNLVIEGWVPSVDAVYKTCRVFIAPLQSGAGIKGKVIGALASGVPCVLSSIAAEGIPMVDDVVACIADKPEEWVSDIARLYNDRKLWADMSKQARVFSQNLYSFNKGVVQMRDALQQAEIFTDMDNGALALR